MDLDEIRSLATRLEAGIISKGEGHLYEAYEEDRSLLLDEVGLQDVLPMVVKSCRNESMLWGHLKSVAYGSGAYAARREHVHGQFTPLFERLDALKRGALTEDQDAVIATVPRARFHLNRAHQLIESDPESAVTKARNVLESVCKHILDELGVDYANDIDLSPLVKLTSSTIELPLEAKAFSGISTLANLIAEVRNKYSDAHGGGALPAKELAQLVVHLAGATAIYFLQHHDSRSASAANAPDPF